MNEIPSKLGDLNTLSFASDSSLDQGICSCPSASNGHSQRNDLFGDLMKSSRDMINLWKKCRYSTPPSVSRWIDKRAINLLWRYCVAWELLLLIGGVTSSESEDFSLWLLGLVSVTTLVSASSGSED
ncbi:hypothetical protein TNCV_4409301 [Trichonephila clavipes]|nr:hypothetical protein TNCV_4409301 [Trichonephila clavipes]